jgi:diaminopimelate decarboxylase
MIAKLAVFPVTAQANQGHLLIGGQDAVELAEKYGTPLYVFDEATIRRQCQSFRSEFSRRYADTTVVYASKAFLHPAIATIMKEEGLGLDVVSGGELSIADGAGFPMDMVYFHGNNKSAEELRLALKRHVGRIVVDNLDELRLLTKLAEESAHIPDIMLRILPGVDAHTHGHLTTGAVGSKFGIPLYKAEEAMTLAMAAASLNLVGLHFHLGSSITETQPYLDAIDLVVDLVAEMRHKYGFEIEELDIGGGFAAQYTLDNPVPDAGYFADKIVPALLERCQHHHLPTPTLTIEPGRALVARAGVALYRVGVQKEVPESGLYAAVDGGMADNIRPALYDAKYEVLAAGKTGEKETVQTTVVGRYCESGDILVRNASLPVLGAGDVLAVPAAGAYCVPMQSNYNGALKPAIVMVADGSARLIRRRETYQDLTRCDLA